MSRNSNLCLYMLASLRQPALNAAIAAGALSKSDIAVVNALRSGGGHRAAHGKMIGAIRKQFTERAQHDAQVRKAVEDYARAAVKKETEKMSLTDHVLADRVDKARTEQKLYGDLIKAYAKEHPLASRQDCVDAILLGPIGKKLVELDREIDALAKAKNTLAQPPHTGAIDFSQPGVRGRTGYSSADNDTHPQNPDDGEGVTIHDYHQLLEDLKSGKVPWNDPKVSALVALERKHVFEKNT
jgi:hypothetical protein